MRLDLRESAITAHPGKRRVIVPGDPAAKDAATPQGGQHKLDAERDRLTMADVYAALAYYWDHRDEIQRDMQAESDLLIHLRQSSASPLAEKLAAANG